MKQYTIYIKPISINDIQRVNHYKLAKIKKEYSSLIGWQLKQQGIKKIKTPCSIVYEISWADKRRRDLENYALTVKYINDVLLSPKRNDYGLGIIEDDDLKHIPAISIRVGRYNGQEERVDMFIHEL